ncbi:MAG: IS1 family transposase [Blastocatellia bacterium]
MANILPMEKRVAVVGALAEGNSIRAIERMTGIHRDTIMRLGVRIGEGCHRLLDGMMRDLPCERIEVDEIWGFIGKKQRHVTTEAESWEKGDAWTFIAVDADSKLVPCFHVGKRSTDDTVAFVTDLSSRLKNRVQLSSDAMPAYVWGVEQGFGCEVDYGQVIKTFSATPGHHHTERKYSPGQVTQTVKKVIMGTPSKRLISTSYVESQNLTVRMHVRRLTRLTNAFSKKLDNFKAAIALHFAYYNLVKRHTTLRMTPAMAAGVTDTFWTVADLIERAK